MRAELSPAQQAEHLARRKEVWEQLQNSGTICSTNRGRPKEFAQDTASKTGGTKQDINRHIARAEALGPDIKLVAGTSLDKGVELDALAKMTPEQRAPVIRRAVAGEQVSARPVLADQEVILQQANAIIATWNRARQAAPLFRFQSQYIKRAALPTERIAQDRGFTSAALQLLGDAAFSGEANGLIIGQRHFKCGAGGCEG